MTPATLLQHNLPEAPNRPVPALQCYLAYISALLAGVITWRILQGRALPGNVLWIGFVVTCVSTVVIWVFSIANRNSSIYDPYWVVAPPLLALAVKATGDGSLTGPWAARQVIIVAAFIVWASRYHIFYAWAGWRTGLVHEDWRYELMRKAPVPYWLNSLLGMHLFPTVLVYIAFAPAALILSSNPAMQAGLNLWDIVGVIGVVAAVTIELVADRQLRAFRNSDSYSPGATFRAGLWKYSRHPNYFGEVLFWVSMIPFAAASTILATHTALALTGPVLMGVFFRFSSWLMDVRSLGRRPDYPVVMEEVSAMIPWWPREADQGRRNSEAR